MLDKYPILIIVPHSTSKTNKKKMLETSSYHVDVAKLYEFLVCIAINRACFALNVIILHNERVSWLKGRWHNNINPKGHYYIQVPNL
jgi:hypothetical protein